MWKRCFWSNGRGRKRLSADGSTEDWGYSRLSAAGQAWEPVRRQGCLPHIAEWMTLPSGRGSVTVIKGGKERKGIGTVGVW
jgi:hypothetical protein